jgi:hypothetical protein
MAQRKILIDSNTYFRVARDIHPLLGVEFSEEKICLYIIDEFEEEYFRGTGRLKTKFEWVNNSEYKDNRKKKVSRSKEEQKKIVDTARFLDETAKETDSTASPVDIQALATAYVLNIEVVTDDSGMLLLAEEFEIRTLKTLELLKLLLDCGHIDIAKIRAIVQYWHWLHDLPKSCAEDFHKIFSEEMPQSA